MIPVVQLFFLVKQIRLQQARHDPILHFIYLHITLQFINYIYSHMNQRSHSFLKRFKTQRADKPTISTRNLLSKTPIHKKENDRSKTPITKKQVIQYIQLRHKDDYDLKCINHFTKKALFENKDKPSEVFCYECAIKLVKMNARLSKLSQKSLYLRGSLEQQLQILYQYEKYTHEVIRDIFSNLRQKYTLSYQTAKNSENLKIQLPTINKRFKDEIDFESKVQSIIGEFSMKKVQFIENSPLKLSQKQGNQRESSTKSIIKIPKSRGGSKVLQNKENMGNLINFQKNPENSYTKNPFFDDQFNIPEFSLSHQLH